MLSFLAVAWGFGGGLVGVRRFLKRRYQDLYASEEPEFQSSLVIPTSNSSGRVG